MKRTATVIETVTYTITFYVPDGADETAIEDAAHEEWGINPSRKPDDYECSIEINGD